MRSAPTGPRTRQPTHPQSSTSSSRPPGGGGSAGRPADRDQVFASIFGRQASGHHASRATAGSSGYGRGGMPGPMPPPAGGSGYEQFAPPLPPGMPPAFNGPPPGPQGTSNPDYMHYSNAPHSAMPRAGYTGGPPMQGTHDARQRRSSFTPSSVPPLPTTGYPSAVSYNNPSAQHYPSRQASYNTQMNEPQRTAYAPGPYPPDRNRSTSSQNVAHLPPQISSPALGGVPPSRQGMGSTAGQSYRLQDGEYSVGGGSSTGPSIYEERPDPLSRESWASANTQSLGMRTRPSSGASGHTNGTAPFESPTADVLSAREHDNNSPPRITRPWTLLSAADQVNIRQCNLAQAMS